MIQHVNGHAIIVNPTPEEARFYKIQAEWRIASPAAREAIAEELSLHPEWGIQIIGSRIEKTWKN